MEINCDLDVFDECLNCSNYGCIISSPAEICPNCYTKMDEQIIIEKADE